MVSNQANQNNMQGIKSEHEYKGGRVGWVGHEIYREDGVSQFYLQGGVGCGNFHWIIWSVTS